MQRALINEGSLYVTEMFAELKKGAHSIKIYLHETL